MGRRVLVVEDDAQLQVLAVRVLRTYGYEAEIAGDGREALRIASRVPPPDLVLMDLALPDQDGIEVTRALKAANPGLLIIAVSAHAMSSDRERAREAGCEAFLTKPYQIDQLVHVVRTALGESDPAQSELPAGGSNPT
ncbi:MAG TPA: response regulator [Candidatus Dormibacteraeota bacterium]|nr:response regulator [Candidatus Dormibacteraeota bacterium]